MKFLYIGLFFLINLNLYSTPQIVVVTCSYNNKNYYQKNLQSLFDQTFQDWVCYYVDDCSTDGTYELAYEFAKSQNMLDKMIFIKNKYNLGTLENQYNVISACADRQVIVVLDGDDCFYGSDNLAYIHEVYQDPNVWLTYGSYVPLKEPFPVFCADVSCAKNINNKDFFRKSRWVFSHLRTFYAGIFKKIKKEDLMFKGKFLKSCSDHAVMLPMLEMANGETKHYKYLDKKLYIYNNQNPICEFRRRDLDTRLVSFIRNKNSYEAIENF